MALLSITKQDKATIAKFTEKRLDAKIAVSFRNEMEQVIATGVSVLILDLSEAGFVDSSGLGAIVTSLKLLGRKGDLLIAGVRDDVMTMFTLTRMDRVFQMFPTAEDALKSIPS